MRKAERQARFLEGLWFIAFTAIETWAVVTGRQEPLPTDYLFFPSRDPSTPRTISRPTEEPMVRARLLAEA